MKKAIMFLLTGMLLASLLAMPTLAIEIDEKDFDGNMNDPGCVPITFRLPDKESPDWSTSNDSTHQFLVQRAFEIICRNYASNPFNDSSNYITLLRNGADWPDQYENDSASWMYKGHFYDPDTGKNYMGETSPTAKSRFLAWYNQAVQSYKSNLKTTAMQQLGRALHYVGDLGVPQHAANLTAGDIGSYHLQFEAYAVENQHSYLVLNVSSDTFTWARNTSPSNMAQNFAVFSKGWIDEAKNPNTFATALSNTLTKSQRNCAAIMYRFMLDIGYIN